MGKLNKDNLRKTIYYLRKNGLQNTFYALQERLQKKETDSYTYAGLPDSELKQQREKKWQEPVLFSILVPLYHTPLEYLKELLESVLQQTYPYFQLVLLDASEDEEKQDAIEKLIRGYGEERICYQTLSENKGIAENTNAGLAFVKGDYIGLLDHDDLLTPDALFEMAHAISGAKERGMELQLLYSDEDKCDGEAKVFYEPHFKKDFDPELLLTNNYICHFTVLKSELFQELKLRGDYNGAQDFDLVLRVAARFRKTPEVICHIPKVLYHWRCHISSTAANPASKTYAYEAGKRAVESYVAACGWQAEVEHLKHLGFYRVIYEKDIFEQRPEVGAVGGSLLGKKNRICGGLSDAGGKVIYEGLLGKFSGYMNRAVLVQQAAVLDIRCMKVNPACEELLKETLKEMGITEEGYCRTEKGIFLKDKEADYTALNRKVSEAIWAAGYCLLWDPGWQERL